MFLWIILILTWKTFAQWIWINGRRFAYSRAKFFNYDLYICFFCMYSISLSIFRFFFSFWAAFQPAFWLTRTHKCLRSFLFSLSLSRVISSLFNRMKDDLVEPMKLQRGRPRTTTKAILQNSHCPKANKMGKMNFIFSD